MTTIVMPDQRVLRHFPEAPALAVLDAALVAVELVLREEHPALDHAPLSPEYDISPLALSAYLILTRTLELRELIRFYSGGVDRSLCYHFDADPDDVIT
jgi:hypothetical protein